MKSIRILTVLLAIGLLAIGCSTDPELTAPTNQTNYSYDKNGTETLGTPTIAIAGGSGFAEGGVGMVGVSEGVMTVDVPAGATINQALLYWVGGTTGAPGDDMVKIDGNDVTGELIGGPTNFFSNYWFSAYRADITDMDLVVAGANSFTISDFDFDYSGGSLDENNGIGMLVIYDDGTMVDISVLDGLDMAYFDFAPTLDSTVPQTFTFDAEPADRMANMVIFAGSVGVGRPNGIKITTSAGDDLRSDLLGSEEGLLWDSLMIDDILIPAGDTSVTVELISTITELDPVEDRGASMAWTAAGFSIPVSPELELACLGDYVWEDLNMDGVQDDGEPGIEGVTVYLMDCQGGELARAITDETGMYMFCDLEPGSYNVKFELLDGYTFSPMNIGDPAADSDADPATGMAACTDLESGEYDMTWDAGMYYEEPPEDCEDCDGKVTVLTLQYNGSEDAQIVVEQKKDHIVVFDEFVMAGEQFTIYGEDKHGTLGTEIKIFVDGQENTKIHTSCSQPIGPGLVSGDFEVISGESRNGGLLCPVEWNPPGDDCDECEGKVTELTLQFNGTSTANIMVKMKKPNDVVFSGTVDPGEMFSFVGTDKKGTLGTEIKIYVDGVENTKIHTSCSQPIGPGLVSGDFEVIEGRSRNGGELCPVEPTPPDEEDCECDGKVTTLTLEYLGSDVDAHVVVKQKDGVAVFDGTVQPGESFSFQGQDKKDTLGTEIKIYVNGEENTKIHTSCSQPIGPGLVSGDFLVLEGASRNNGPLCPLNMKSDHKFR